MINRITNTRKRERKELINTITNTRKIESIYTYVMTTYATPVVYGFTLRKLFFVIFF